MTWSQSWSGLGPIQASSLAVVGQTTEIDIVVDQAGGPPPAAIIFKNPADATVAPAKIYGQQSHGAMDIQVNTQSDTNGRSSFAFFGGDYLDLDHINTNLGITTRIKLLDGLINTLGTITPEGETWHAFSYQNGWADLGGNWSTGAYKLNSIGHVELKGVIIGGTKTDGTVIATLPAGYRPPKDVILGPALISGGSTNPNYQIRIFSATGQIQCFGISTTTSGNMSLDGLYFSLSQ